MAVPRFHPFPIRLSSCPHGLRYPTRSVCPPPPGGSGFRRRLARWYDGHARDLPWRRQNDAYSVWVSEIMLQQTQVATVCGYFTRFMAALPTIAALAEADERHVLRLWEGLGYYRRARQLHEAAQRIVAEHGGQFPRDLDAVRRLPGIGRYTAGAILSIAFDARAPILEANTTRLLARLLAYRGDPASAPGQRLLWAMAEAVLPAREAGRFNQALMELGSQVCSVRRRAARSARWLCCVPPDKPGCRSRFRRRRSKRLPRRCTKQPWWFAEAAACSYCGVPKGGVGRIVGFSPLPRACR